MAAPATDQPQGGVVTALALAEAARRLQLATRAQMARDVTTAWAALDLQQVNSTWPGWIRVMLALLTRYHGQSAQQSALFYLAARQHALGAVPDAALAKLAAPPSVQWLQRALGYAGPGEYGRQLSLGRDASVAERAALTQVLGTASRITLDGARTTIADSVRADREAVGFYRVTDGDPCAFCALMASRGAVYKTSKSAGVDDQWHNDCGCSVAPAFSRDVELPEVSRRAAQVYAARGAGPALKAFRASWNAQRPAAAAA